MNPSAPSAAHLMIGVAGGSGSGKTTILEAFLGLCPCPVTVLPQDAYYHDLSPLPLVERGRQNFDHPDALDSSLFEAHLLQLRRGQPVPAPLYDFTTHTRIGTHPIAPAPVILAEGTLVLAIAALARHLTLRVFVDAPPDIRFIRRLQRDRVERGRSVDSVIQQYLETVRPMDLAFIAPCKAHADLVLDGLVDPMESAQILNQALRPLLPR